MRVNLPATTGPTIIVSVPCMRLELKANSSDCSKRRSVEPLEQDRILRCNTNRAHVEMALAYDGAAHNNQWSGGEATLVSAQHEATTMLRHDLS